MERLKKLSTGKKLIILGCLLTVVSLFLYWGGWAGENCTGLQFHAYLIIIALIYPFYNSYTDRVIDKKKSMISLVLGLLFIFYIRIVAFRNMFGYVPGKYMLTGMKMAIVGVIVAMVGVILTQNDKNRVE